MCTELTERGGGGGGSFAAGEIFFDKERMGKGGGLCLEGEGEKEDMEDSEGTGRRK